MTGASVCSRPASGMFVALHVHAFRAHVRHVCRLDHCGLSFNPALRRSSQTVYQTPASGLHGAASPAASAAGPPGEQATPGQASAASPLHSADPPR